jgi:hypothetical protein
MYNKTLERLESLWLKSVPLLSPFTISYPLKPPAVSEDEKRGFEAEESGV